MFWCSLVGADRAPKQAMPVARQEDLGLCALWPLSLSHSPFQWHCMFRSGRVDGLVFFDRNGPRA